MSTTPSICEGQSGWYRAASPAECGVIGVWCAPQRNSGLLARPLNVERSARSCTPGHAASRRCDTVSSSNRLVLPGLGWGRVKALTLIASLILSAFLLAVALASPEHSWFRWITLLPLLAAIRMLSPGKATACGALWGGSFFLFSAFAVETGLVPTIGALVPLTAIPAVYAGLGAWVARRLDFSPLFLALTWVGAGLALDLTGLRPSLLTSAQGGGAHVQLVEVLLKSVFVGFVIAYANGLAVSALSTFRLILGGSRIIKASGGPIRRLSDLFSLQRTAFAIRLGQPRAPPVFRPESVVMVLRGSMWTYLERKPALLGTDVWSP